VTRRPSRAAVVGIVVAAIASVVYWNSGRDFNAGRGDFFYLADAFLHGRTWLDFRPGPYDVIPDGNRFYVPFAPFSAIALMPLVALTGAVTADQLESGIDAVLAGGAVWLCWVLLGRLGDVRLRDRLWLIVLFAFSTPIWWVALRGGVWHTGQIIATILTLGCLLELWGNRRPFVVGALAGAAFLSRAPLAFAVPFYLLLIDPRLAESDPPDLGVLAAIRRWPVRRWALLSAGIFPSIAFFLWYNAVRFGSPLESGYGLAALPPWLDAVRREGLFSLAHVPMNIDYLFLHLPTIIPDFPFLKPDGLGLSVFLTSPALALAVFADWRSPRARLLLGAAAAVLIPTLLYYGGGWLQYSYRYFLDSVPFVIALTGLAVVRTGRLSWRWKAAIVFGVVVNAGGAYWVSRF
jgi:hypothetical protein